MTFFTASFETVILRFALMMATVIGSFVAGVPLLAILALPIFLSAMTAVTIVKAQPKRKARMEVSIGEVSPSKQAA